MPRGTATEAAAAEPHGRAYLFRGMIDLIDWGMDQLAGRINRIGVAANISSHVRSLEMLGKFQSRLTRDTNVGGLGRGWGRDGVIAPSRSPLSAIPITAAMPPYGRSG